MVWVQGRPADAHGLSRRPLCSIQTRQVPVRLRAKQNRRPARLSGLGVEGHRRRGPGSEKPGPLTQRSSGQISQVPCAATEFTQTAFTPRNGDVCETGRRPP